MRESTLRVINYVMIVAILVTLSIHLAVHAFLGVSGYEESLQYDGVVSRYRSALSASMLTVLLVAASFHGLYGLRTTLLGFRTGVWWDRAVSFGVVAAGAVLVGWGTRTIVMMFGGA